MSLQAPPAQATRGKDPPEIPAPDWLRSFGCIAAVVVGHVLIMNFLVIGRIDLNEWSRLAVGVMCGQATVLCLLAVTGPGLLFWRLAGALFGLVVIGFVMRA